MKLSTSIPIYFCLALAAVSIFAPQNCLAQSAAPASQLRTAEAVFADAKQKMMLEQQRLDETRHHFETAEEGLQKQFAKEADLGVSLESFPDIIRILQTQRIELMIELAGLDAKRELLAKSIDGKDSNQEVELLQDTYVLFAKRLASLKKLAAKGSASNTDVMSAQLSTNQAKLKLIKAKSATGDSHETAVLLDLSLERAERKARLAKTEELLANIAKARPVLNEREELTRGKKLAWDRMVMIQDQLRDREEQLRAAQRELDRIKKLENME